MYKRRMRSPVIVVCLLLLFFHISSSSAQTVSLRMEANVGSFVMTDPKEFQDGLPYALLGANHESIPYKVYHNFKPTPGYDMVLTFGIGRQDLSLLGGINSTGSRLHYRDYSGEIKVDQVLSNIHLAIDYSVATLPWKYNIVFKPSVAGGMTFSNHQLMSLHVL